MKPVLAVCGSPDHFEPEASVPYEEALRAAGIEPVLIRPGDPIPADVRGLLLMGGTDVNPTRFGESPQPETEAPDDARDALELQLLDDFIARDMPVLAICRGLQILNVHQGGTLTQHLSNTAHHRVRPPDRGLPAHRVDLKPSTKLASIEEGAVSLDVNSRHHQAIAELGASLIASARDPEDGAIEAVERPDKSFVLGVQWHPENQQSRDPRQANIFRAFAAAL